jgi:hypothetical protein
VGQDKRELQFELNNKLTLSKQSNHGGRINLIKSRTILFVYGVADENL